MEIPAQSKGRVRFAVFEVDLRTGELRTNAYRVNLQEKPFKILIALLERPGEMVTRDELKKRLWPAGTFVDFDLSLNKAVNRLREALDDSAEQPRFIETLPRRGYRFIAPLETEPAQTSDQNRPPQPVTSRPSPMRAPVSAGRICDPSTDTKVAVSSTAVVHAPAPASIRAPRKLKYLPVAITLALAIVTAVGLGVWHVRRPRVNFETLRITKLSDSGKAVQVAISQDGRFAAYALGHGEKFDLWLHQVSTHGDIRILPPEPGYIAGLTFSPDGSVIYFVRSNKNVHGSTYLSIVPVLGGAARLLMRNVDSAVSFSPDGRHFVFTRGVPMRNATEIRIANADGSGNRLLTTILNTFTGHQPGPAWSPDGRSVAVSIHTNKDFVLDSVSVTDGSTRQIFSSTRAIGRPQWLPEGDALLAELDDQTQRGQLWLISYPQGHARRLTNDLANYDLPTSATRDARTIVAVQWGIGFHLWVLPGADTSKAREITSGELPLGDLVVGPRGKVLAVSKDAELWIVNPDGSEPALFTDINNVEFPAWCGGFVVFNTYRNGPVEIMRVNADGTSPVKLATGQFTPPVCAPNSSYMFTEDMAAPPRLVRISIEGGKPLDVAPLIGDGFGRLSISPDGKLLAYPFQTANPEPLRRMAIIPAAGGPPLRTFPISGEAHGFRWAPDGRTLQYWLTRDEATNIWEQPADGGRPKQLTRFTAGQIADFGWSQDGKQLFISRGEVIGDPVLLTNFR